MRVRVLLVVAALLQPAAALADEPDPMEVLKRVRPVREQWLRCAAAQASRLLRTQLDADKIADAALSRCKAKERPLERLLRDELGAEGAARVLRLVRVQDRTNLIRIIEKRRAE